MPFEKGLGLSPLPEGRRRRTGSILGYPGIGFLSQTDFGSPRRKPQPLFRVSPFARRDSLIRPPGHGDSQPTKPPRRRLPLSPPSRTSDLTACTGQIGSGSLKTSIVICPYFKLHGTYLPMSKKSVIQRRKRAPMRAPSFIFCVWVLFGGSTAILASYRWWGRGLSGLTPHPPTFLLGPGSAPKSDQDQATVGRSCIPGVNPVPSTSAHHLHLIDDDTEDARRRKRAGHLRRRSTCAGWTPSAKESARGRGKWNGRGRGKGGGRGSLPSGGAAARSTCRCPSARSCTTGRTHRGCGSLAGGRSGYYDDAGHANNGGTGASGSVGGGGGPPLTVEDLERHYFQLYEQRAQDGGAAECDRADDGGGKARAGRAVRGRDSGGGQKQQARGRAAAAGARVRA
ncbi:hypothetical protein FB451DRAFT_1364409 [Mycena latifolia]|nr:hypothetical protein FB451DRAFT_1364409 [Mycena latifolia]